MHTSTYNIQKSHMELEIGTCQSVIASVVASEEMPEERKAAYLDYYQPRQAELEAQLTKLSQDYWGSYYGYSTCGATIG